MAGFVDHPPSPCPQSRRASPQVPWRLRRHPPRGPHSASAGGGGRGLLDPSFCAPALAPPLPRAPRPKRSLETRAPRAPGHPGPRRALAALLTRHLWAGAHPPPPRPTSPSRARLPCASPHAVRPRLFETPAGSRTARSSRSASRSVALPRCPGRRPLSPQSPQSPHPPVPTPQACSERAARGHTCFVPPRRRRVHPRRGTCRQLREALAFERVKVGGHPSVGFREPPRAGAGGSRGPVGRAEGLGTEPLAGSCSQTARGAAKG